MAGVGKAFYLTDPVHIKGKRPSLTFYGPGATNRLSLRYLEAW